MATRVPLSTRKPRGRGFERREEILAAAEALFEARGLDTPLRDIAATAGLSQASLFKHFATRAELIEAVRTTVYARLEEDITRAEAAPTDVKANLDVIFRAHAALARERPSIFSLAFPSSGQLAGLESGGGRGVSLPGLERLRTALGRSGRAPLDLMPLGSWFLIYGMALTVALEFGRDRLKAEETISAVLDLLVSQISGLG